MPGDRGRLGWRGGVGALAIAGLLAGARVALAQVSPGPLAGPHASLDGATQCFQCHVRGGRPADMDGRCLACHTEVARMKQANRGYHARVDKNCATCHPDHAGRTFSLIAWEEGTPEKFDHTRTGWALEGAHTKVACRDCHQPKFQRWPLGTSRKKDKAASWLGLDTACGSCHVDAHRGRLGLECLTCHRVDAWRPAPGFNHAKTSFPLTGRHAIVACDKCHATPALLAASTDSTSLAAAHAPGSTRRVYAPVPHDDCARCHHDPHAGRFGAACARCHTNTDSFHTIRAAGFDHDKTRYPLRGRHATLACASCHDPKHGGWGEKPAFAACTSCHRDAHAGTATLAGKAVDCASCHDVSGFGHPTYTIAQHARSGYPLEGAHARAACETCHAKASAGATAVASLGSARVIIRPPHGACVDCHVDPHGGRFTAASASKARGAASRAVGDCLTCHSIDAFRPSGVDATVHAHYAFVLQGAHRAVPCEACHSSLGHPRVKTLRGAAGAASLRLAFDDARTECVACHRSPHGDQFAHRRDKGACEGCHGVDAFAPVDHFDHNRDTPFSLAGAHQRTPCASCHVPSADPNAVPRVRYRPTPSRCVDCHDRGAGGDGRKAPMAARAIPILLTSREAFHATR